MLPPFRVEAGGLARLEEDESHVLGNFGQNNEYMLLRSLGLDPGCDVASPPSFRAGARLPAHPCPLLSSDGRHERGAA